MKLNVSQVKTFQYDQLDWYYAYVLKRVPRHPSKALLLGTLWHTLQEEFARTGSRESALARFGEVVHQMVEDHRSVVSGKFIEEFLVESNLLPLYFEHHVERFLPENVLGVEMALEMPIDGGHTLLGRPDKIVRLEGQIGRASCRERV